MQPGLRIPVVSGQFLFCSASPNFCNLSESQTKFGSLFQIMTKWHTLLNLEQSLTPQHAFTVIYLNFNFQIKIVKGFFLSSPSYPFLNRYPIRGK